MGIQAASHTVLVDRIIANRRVLSDVFLIAIGSLVVAALAQIAVPIGPVPVTGQTLGVLLVAAALGARRGAGALALYVAQGAAGLPVFAGGTGGIGVLAGPTGGYLLGFIAAAFIVGRLCELGLDRRPSGVAISMVTGHLLIYLFGVVGLSRFVGWERVLSLGVTPFLLGDVVKLAVAAMLLPGAWRFVGRGN
jgi:biotin transport system substrate-specific component